MNLQLSGVTESCPNPSCNGVGRVVEGGFNITGGEYGIPERIFQISGAPVDTELFTRVGLILVQSQLDRAKPAEVVERIAPHSPTLARRLSALVDNPAAFATIIAAFIAAVAAVTTAKIASSASSSPPPIIINNYTISEGELNRQRNNLYELRKKNTPLPDWVSEYF